MNLKRWGSFNIDLKLVFVNDLVKKDFINKRYDIFNVKTIFVKLVLICKWNIDCSKAIVSKDFFWSRFVFNKKLDNLIWESLSNKIYDRFRNIIVLIICERVLVYNKMFIKSVVWWKGVFVKSIDNSLFKSYWFSNEVCFDRFILIFLFVRLFVEIFYKLILKVFRRYALIECIFILLIFLLII